MTEYSDAHLRQVLQAAKTIALVGFSANPERPSYKVARYLAEHGYRVIPVNPGLAGQAFMGEKVVAGLDDIPADAKVDFLDVFRRSEAVPAIVEAALAKLPDLRVVWLQIGVQSNEAREMVEAKGLTHIENICPKIEHARLFG